MSEFNTVSEAKEVWSGQLATVLELQSRAEDILAQLNEELGNLESDRYNVEEFLSERLDELDQDSPEFKAMAHVLSKWEELGVEDLMLEWTVEDDEVWRSFRESKLPWPEERDSDDE
ncbi:MAG: hypothetical protein ACYSW3_29070 [Planctomycetota bacterium]|jgi:hypothetical protein